MPARPVFAIVRQDGDPEGCAVARGATDTDLEGMNRSWLTPPEFARMTAEYDRVVSI
jgi:hypothetical protein